MSLLQRYRATGADLPFGHPDHAHPGIAMEGWFWRLTDRESGLAVIALCGVNTSTSGPWALSALATGGAPAVVAPSLRIAPIEGSGDDLAVRYHGLGVRVGDAFLGTDTVLRVDLGPKARLDVDLGGLRRWPRAAFGGSSVFQSVPALNQYWHPWCLGGRANGTLVVGGHEHELRDLEVYGEKNWGREGFPDAWWWGQAQGFGDGACVAFAGGQIHTRVFRTMNTRAFRTEVTGLVVALPDGRVVRLGNPVIDPVTAEVTDESWRLRGRGRGWEVEVDASAQLGDAHVLPVPLPSERRCVPGAIEHLTGSMDVTVRRRDQIVWEGHSDVAGLEHGGLQRAAAEMRRRGAPDDAGAPPQRTS